MAPDRSNSRGESFKSAETAQGKLSGEQGPGVVGSAFLAERFLALVEGVKDYAIFMLDPAGHVVTWNLGAERIKGYHADEIVGKDFSIFYPPEDVAADKPARELKIAAECGRVEDQGWRLRRDGSRFWADVVITALRAKDGSLAGFTKVTRDATERNRAEAALRASENRFRSLFEFSPDAIVTSDTQGKILEVNGRVSKFFGYSRDELLGQPIDILVPERFRGAHPGFRKGYGLNPHMRPMGIGLELFARRKDGSEFPVDIMLAPIEMPDGPIVLSTIRDISERKEAEQALFRAHQEKCYLEEELRTSFEEIVGDAASLKQALKQVEIVAPTDATVLVLGETGTGKELIARAIHHLSRRSSRTFVKLNCAAIPSGLLESELFGHERGAFTGAISQKVGRLELADQGTLFLDEVGDIPLELQPKLLRALQEKEFERLGSTRTISVDIRLIAATNRDLEKMVGQGTFRSDLYYRLKVFPIHIPALRERPNDIPLLVRYFVHMHARRMDKSIETIPQSIMDALMRWKWPGNVRELENFIERAVILTPGKELRAPLGELQASHDGPAQRERTLEQSDREHIIGVLRQTKGAIGGTRGAAERLGLKRTTLNSKIKKLGIAREDYS